MVLAPARQNVTEIRVKLLQVFMPGVPVTVKM